jgi:antitoxin MazE
MPTKKTKKDGPSRVIALPDDLYRRLLKRAKERGATPDTVAAEILSDQLPPARRRKYSLKELVDGITPENRHEETDTGPPVGREIW